MANPLRGEVEVATPSGVVTFRFTANALCALEADMDMGVAKIGALLGDPERFRIGMARKFVRAAMQHERPKASEEDAGVLMDEVGIVEAINAAARAFQLAFPQGGGEGEADPRPPAGGPG